MSEHGLIFRQGVVDTRAALHTWAHRPGAILLSWTLGSLTITLLLYLVVAVLASFVVPDPTLLDFPGVTRGVTTGDYSYVLGRNSLVLALHAMACVAGFMAGSSLPQSVELRTGISRWVHEKAGPLAIGFVVLATAFSLFTQSVALGFGASSLAAQLGMSSNELLLRLTPHAIPELFALFLPLAAWMIASREGRWNELLAATFVTVAIAVPIVLVSAWVEVYVTPDVLRAGVR